jgi:hypothetical protein
MAPVRSRETDRSPQRYSSPVTGAQRGPLLRATVCASWVWSGAVPALQATTLSVSESHGLRWFVLIVATVFSAEVCAPRP